MKIAVPYENEQIFQHFGHTEKVKVYEVDGGKIVSSEVVNTNGQGHGEGAQSCGDHGCGTHSYH